MALNAECGRPIKGESKKPLDAMHVTGIKLSVSWNYDGIKMDNI